MLNLNEAKIYVKENWNVVADEFTRGSIDYADESDDLCQYVLDQYLIKEINKATEEEIKNLDRETINYLIDIYDVYELYSEDAIDTIPNIVWDMAHKYNELAYNGCIINIK